METITELAPSLGVRPLCHALSLASATYYRHRKPRLTEMPAEMPRANARALMQDERSRVLEALHEPRFVDLAPGEVYATLLDEGTYLCSERTMYRVLSENNEVRERRDVSRHTHYAAPELLATKPNELWSWDITKLKGPAKWNWYHLYTACTSSLTCTAGTWWGGCLASQGDRLAGWSLRGNRRPWPSGSSMTSKPVALLLADLGITKTHSRPHVSNDNPYSESQFKTLKYRPDFPDRFGSIEHSRLHCTDFFRWYNDYHRHSGLGLHTPHDVHYGKAELRRTHRAVVLQAAYAQHPERFVNKSPTPPALPAAAWINEPITLTERTAL